MEDRENGMLQQEDVAPVESGEEAEANDIASLTLEDEREFVREIIRKRRQHDWVSRAIFQPAKPKPNIRDEGKKMSQPTLVSVHSAKIRHPPLRIRLNIIPRR